MIIQEDEDGWQAEQITLEKQPEQLAFTFRNLKNYEGREILSLHRHSLEPDMALGWRPKLPSCPLPLAYTNIYTDALLSYIPTDDRFKIIFLGPRPSNSVQVNQQYQYPWRYRSRYNTSLAEVQSAVKRVWPHNKRPILNNAGDIDFDSSFESGNLDMAVRIKKNEFDLFLRSDTNTQGHTCWYYFKVNNKDLTGEVKFNLCNFSKRKNLYGKGLKPYELVQGGEWQQENCYQVNYVERYCRYGFDRKDFQLQFKYYFTQRNQTVYFAYSIPYTYSQLHRFIADELKKHRFVEYSKLCETLGGLEVPLLKVTDRNEEGKQQDKPSNQQLKRKKIVLVSGRIHPGQPHSSLMIQGFIRHLISDHPSSKRLRKDFIFYIVPMLNPDGVVAGNFRTSYSGKDLNRQYNQLNKNIFPEVTALHDLAQQLKNNHPSFQYYFDFHSHSYKKGLFCYGPEHFPGRVEYYQSRALAKFIQQKTAIFSYHRSIFTIADTKMSTGRAHMLWRLKIPQSFTFQVSAGLYETKERKCMPFTSQDIKQLGASVLQGFHRYSQLEVKMPALPAIRSKIDSGIRPVKPLRIHTESSPKSRTQPSQKCETEPSAKYYRRRSTATKRSSTTAKQVMKIKDDLALSIIIKSKLPNQQFSVESKSTDDKEEFMKVLCQIKKESLEMSYRVIDQYEGHSDSESEGDDLPQEEMARLHHAIATRNQTGKISFFGLEEWRSEQKRVQLLRRQQKPMKQNDQTAVSSQQRHRITSKYLQSFRHPIPPRSKRLHVIQTNKLALNTKTITFDL